MVRKMSPSLEKRVSNWLDRDYRETFMERIQLLFEAEERYEKEGPSVRYGHTLEHILKNITVVLGEGPLAKDGSLSLNTKTRKDV